MYNNRGVILERRDVPMGNYKDGVWLLVRDLQTGAYVTMWGDPVQRTDLMFAAKDQRIGYTLNGNQITLFGIFWLESPGFGEVVGNVPTDSALKGPSFPPGMYNNRATVVMTRRMMMGNGKDGVWLVVREFESGALVSMFGDPMVMTDLAFADRNYLIGYTLNGNSSQLAKFGISWIESPHTWETESAAAVAGK
jgi:hypothetical protein